MTLEALAKASDLHWTYLSGIERGRRNPTLQVLGAIAEALDVKTSQLILLAEELDCGGPVEVIDLPAALGPPAAARPAARPRPRRAPHRWWAVGTAACSVELAGVLAIGTWSLLDPTLFPAATVWSGFGSGYGCFPLALPLLGPLYQWRRRPRLAGWRISPNT